MEKHSMHKFFEENILPHYNSIYYYALKTLKNKEAAEDVVQTTLEKAWKNLHKLRDTRKAKSWVYAIARNELWDALKKRDTLAECEFSEELMPEIDMQMVEEDVLKLLMKKHERKEVYEAVQRLSEKYRVLIELRYYWSYSVKEIAEITGMKYSTARVYIHRALKELLNIYSDIDKKG